MKPLTIEELKKLEVGDWVWIVGLVYKTGFYIKKQATNIIEKEYTFYGVGAGGYDYADYGTMWLAYKNKEQAEAKGEIAKWSCNKAGENIYKIIVPVDSEPRIETSTVVTPHTIYIYDDKTEAERRLKELKGE